MAKIFTKKVLEIVGKIPHGSLMTYKEVAVGAGSPKACRAVGSVLNRNYHGREKQLPFEEFEPVPCHRVIRSNSIVGGYALGEKEKERILAMEGHTIINHRIKISNF